MTESTALFDSVQIDWPEIGAGETASLPCPCGDIVCVELLILID